MTARTFAGMTVMSLLFIKRPDNNNNIHIIWRYLGKVFENIENGGNKVIKLKIQSR